MGVSLVMKPGRLVLAAVMGLAVTSIASAQERRKPVSKPVPRYPELAKRMTLTGAVKLEAVVGPDGAVKHITVLGGHPILVNAAVDAVKEWKYEPSKAETVEQINVAFKP